MNVWGKVFFAVLALLLLVCVGGGVAFHMSGGTRAVKEFTEGISGITSSAKTVEKLSREYPFTPPEDGLVSEDRLRDYIEVCREVKPAVDSYEEFLDAHQGKQGDFNDAREAIGMTADLMKTYGEALESRRMSPGEFRWIQRAMDEAIREASSKAGSPIQREMLQALEEAAANPRLAPQERETLRARIEDFRSRIEALPGGSLSPNADLALRYEDDLEAARIGEYGTMILSGQGHPNPHGTVRVDLSE